MAHLSLEGSVVSYEFLDAKKKWRWGVGAVTHSDDRVCIIDQWAGAPVDKTMTAKLESEAAFSKAEAKSHQEHLLSIRERINSQDRMTSKEEKERASKELSECLALIGKHRNRSRSLLADLETMKGSSTVQLKCQQFTPACSSLAILRSSILRVISQTKVPSVVLSSEEVDSIEQSVCSNHSQLNGELRKLRAIFEATEIESNLLRDQIRDLEEQLKHLKNISEPTEIPDRGESVSTFPEKKEEDDSVNLHGAWEIRTALVTTKHTFTFPWDDGDTTLHHKPEETKSLFAAEAAFACCVPIQYVTNIKMTTLGKHLSAEFSVSHPVTVTTKEIDRRLAVYAFPSIQLLHEEPLGVKTGLDKAIESLENALGIPEGKHEGLCFDEFMEIMPDTTFSNDKDAYESEIGDLLMLLDRLNNENRSLQYTLDKSAAEFKRQLSDAQRDHDELNTEISCLRNLIAKLKDLAEEQEKEVESHRLQKQRAEQDRLHHDLPPPAPSLQNEEYAVTISEYNHQKEAAEHALAALTEREEKEKELHNLLKAYEQQCAQYAQQLSSLEQAFAADQDQAAKTSTALESELLDILLHLKASQASVDALRHINSQQHKELEAFRAKRNAALEARDADGTLPVPAKPVPMRDAAARALEPQQIADEPLYAVTVEEYMDKDAAVEQLTAELEEQRAAAERLAEEVAAFRAKRNAALEARDADGTLPVPAKPVPMSDAAARALEPQQIADEPLYAVTVEELCRAREDAARSVEAIGENVAALESELQDVLVLLKAVKGENAALTALCEEKELTVAELKKHDVRANNSDKTKPQSTSRHEKVFEGEDWGAVVENKPHALHDAFVMDVCAACRVGRDDLSEIEFALGSLHASVTVRHDSDISCDDIAKLVEDYHYPNVWALYAKRLSPKDGLDEAKDTISDLQEALTAKEEEVANVAAELEEQRAEAERLAEEVAAFRAKRNAALEARDADGTLPVPAKPVPMSDAAARALEPQQIADEPLYAVTVEEYMDKDAAVEQLTAELEEQRAAAERLAEEVAAFRAKRNAALEARDADGTLPVPAKPVPMRDAAARALEPQQIADEPLYAVTVEEYMDKDAAVEQLTAELEEQRAAAERLAEEVAAFRAKRNAALEARDADGTLPVPAKPVPMRDAAARALEPQQIADEPLYAVTVEEYMDKDAAVEQLTAELEEQRAAAERLAEEVAAFRAKRNAALEARDADGTLPVPAKPVPMSDAAARALEPQQIADEPLYAVTVEEYMDKDAAVEQLTAELEEQRAAAERLAEEVAAFRAKRNAALEARDADGTLPVPAKPVPMRDAAARALEPQQIADEPLYAVTVEEYMDKDAAVEQLTAELEEQRAAAERLAEEVAAFRAKRNAALEARDADGTLPVPAKPVPMSDAAARALEPQQIADEPLYAVTVEELCRAREDAARSVEAIGENVAALESELQDVLVLLKAVKGENAALTALCEEKELTVAELKKHDVRANNSDKTKPQSTSRHEKVFEGEDWGAVVENKPHALHDAFVMDVCAACRVGRDDLSEIEFALGSLHASVTVRHDSDISCDDIAKLVEDYHYPNVWALYAKRLSPKDGLDEAKDTISDLQEALTAKEEEVANVAAELEEQRAEAERLAEEVAAFRAKRNAALEARDADGTLPVPAKPVSMSDAAARALEPQQIADEPLYAVTVEEYMDKDAAVEQLTAELEEQRAAAERLAEEVAAFRAKRNAALEARDADGTLPVPAKPVPMRDAATRALEPQQIADEPLYAVTVEEYMDKDAAVEQLTAELEEQRAEAERLAEEVAAFRAKRNAALEARDADGTLPVPAKPVPMSDAAARALEPQQIADEPLYAVTVEEYMDKDAAVEQLTAELEEQRAAAERLAEEVAAFRAKRNAALEARDADGTLPVPAKPVPMRDAAARALEPQQIADEPLYAVTVEEYMDKDAAVEQLTAELEEQRAAAERLAEEVAAFRAKRNAALEARDADGTLPVPAKPVPMRDAAARALEPQQIADEPLYAVTVEEYMDKDAAVEQLTAELEEQRAAAERLAEEVAAFRAKRNAALEARDADGTLPVPAKPVPMSDAAARALEPQQIADEPLYAVTVEEYMDKDAAVEQLTAELEEQRAAAERLAEEVAAFRAKRNAALEARDADGTLPVPAKPVPMRDAAARALEPQQIADEPLYAVTVEEYMDKDAAVEQLTAELEEQRAAAERLAEEVAAFRAKRNAALEARDADGTLPVPAKPVPMSDAAARALEPQQIADEPLYAVTVEELCRAREDAARSVEAIGENVAALESELQDVLVLLKAVKGENAALTALCEEKELTVAELKKHDVRANNSDKTKPQSTSRHEKVFEGEDWGAVVENKPHALHDAFVMDVCAACRVGRDDLSEIEFALGSLHASVTVRHDSDISCDDIAKLVEDYHYPNVWALYAKRLSPKDGLDEAKDTISDLQEALTAKEEEVANVAAELEEQRAEAERLAEEVAAFRAKRNAALEARDADGTLPVPAKPVSMSDAAARALEPQQIADEPLYAVTVEEYMDKDAAVEQLTAELEEQRAAAERLAEEVAAFRAKRNAALEARDADGTLPVPAKPVPMRDAATRALEPQQIADEPLYAVTVEEYMDKDAAVEQLTAELEEQRAEAERLAEEVAAFRAKRNAALEARDADGTLPVPAKPVPMSDAAARALEPQQIADEPLYAVTVEEYMDKDAAVEQLTAELEEQRAAAERLAEEVAAFRAKRNAALEARDADGTLPVPAKPVPMRDAAARALEPQQIADEPLYAVTVEEYMDKDAAVEQLTAELEEQRAEAERLAEEVAAFRAKRNAALEARDADGTLPVPAKPVPMSDAAARALEPQQIADEPLYAVTVEELCRAREDAARSVEAIGENVAALESELQDVLVLLKAVKGENAALTALCEEKELTVAELKKHDVRANNSDKTKPQSTSRHEKVFEGEDWGAVVENKPHALHDAFVMDVCAACRVGRDDLSEIEFALGSLHASVTVRHDSDISCDDIAKLVEDYHYPNVWALYAKRLSPKDGLDEAKDTISDLQEALTAKEEEVANVAAELEEQRAEAERLAEEVAAFRAKRNAALEARDADGTLPVPAKPVPMSDAAARALEPQQIADEPLYAVTVEEYMDKDAAVEQLTAELEEQRAEAERLAEEVAAFRAKRNAALEARDADGTLPVPAKPVPMSDAAARALEPQQIADEPLYAVTVEEYMDKDAAVEQLTAELEEQRAAAERLAEEVAAFRAKRNAALEARDADGTLPVPAKPVPMSDAAARALEPQQIADEPLYAVTVEEYMDKDAAVEQLTAELEEQRAEAERLAEEVAAFRAKRNAALEARDADGTLPVPAKPVPMSDAAARALEPQQIADEPLYAVTVEEYMDKDAAVEQLTAELEEQRAAAERLAEEVAAFRAKRNAALEARDADGTLPVPAKPVPMSDAAARALEPQQIADEPLYAVTVEEYMDKDAAVEQLTAELEEQRAEAERLAEEVAAFRAKRNAALEARDADGTLPVPAKPVPMRDAAARALEPQQIADEPLYAVTVEEYMDKDAAVEQLTAELEEQRAEAERLAEEVAAFRAKRNAALEARDADGTLPVPAKPVPCATQRRAHWSRSRSPTSRCTP
ncbi:flagellar attachment zone protein, putative [Leishmania tarentolae]|uniref:Flagellar attachment zone protein, putative n=1 Tax=Leishmania tarentolae TaxID=5689 RepID=A0A640KXS8_LEITA|nr:flagellar attachment zone protein, putative [Leishmania tarentolae]